MLGSDYLLTCPPASPDADRSFGCTLLPVIAEQSGKGYRHVCDRRKEGHFRKRLTGCTRLPGVSVRRAGVQRTGVLSWAHMQGFEQKGWFRFAKV